MSWILNLSDDGPSEWDPSRLMALALSNLAIVHDLVASADPSRAPTVQRALVEITSLAVEVGRALLAGAMFDEHEGYRIKELAEALGAELALRRDRQIAAVKGGEKVALQAALMLYGQHVPSCPRARSRIDRCTCGWSEIARGIGVES